MFIDINAPFFDCRVPFLITACRRAREIEKESPNSLYTYNPAEIIQRNSQSITVLSSLI